MSRSSSTHSRASCCWQRTWEMRPRVQASHQTLHFLLAIPPGLLWSFLVPCASCIFPAWLPALSQKRNTVETAHLFLNGSSSETSRLTIQGREVCWPKIWGMGLWPIHIKSLKFQLSALPSQVLKNWWGRKSSHLLSKRWGPGTWPFTSA